MAYVGSKEALKLIKNEDYRNWLMKWDFLHNDDIIINAPIDICYKVNMLKEIEDDEVRKHQRWPDHCKEALLRYDAAIRLIKDDITDDYSNSSYVLHEKVRMNDNGRRVIKENVSTYRTYCQARDAIAMKYHGEEPDEFGNRFNIIDRFDVVDGNYVLKAKFLVSEKGQMWNVRCEKDEVKYYGRPWFTALDLPVPYKPGDIVNVDRRPFDEPYHVLILESEVQEYTFSPFCMRKTEHGMDMRYCESFEEEFDGISPFFGMELFVGELPESEKILGLLSKRIKEDESIIGEICEVCDLNKPENVERRLWDIYG